RSVLESHGGCPARAWLPVARHEVQRITTAAKARVFEGGELIRRAQQQDGACDVASVVVRTEHAEVERAGQRERAIGGEPESGPSQQVPDEEQRRPAWRAVAAA